MKRVKIFVEGQTEETFVRDVLAPYFHRQQVFLTPILAQTSPGHKGGIVRYAKIRRQLERLCKGDVDCTVTTLMDFYKFPKDAPGVEDAAYATLTNCYDKVQRLQENLGEDLGRRNFLPFLMLHEFEAILFCKPDILPDWIEGAAIADVVRVAGACASPEEINEGEVAWLQAKPREHGSGR
jgi:hypothetical protein